MCGVVDLAESDDIYTKTLLGNGQYNMSNSKILILGNVITITGKRVILSYPQEEGMEQH